MGSILLAAAATAASIGLGLAEPIVDIYVNSYDRDGRFDVACRTPAPVARPRSERFEPCEGDGCCAACSGRDARDRRRSYAGNQRSCYCSRRGSAARRLSDRRHFRCRHAGRDPRRYAAGRLTTIVAVEYQCNGIRHEDPRLEPSSALTEELQVPIAVRSGSGPTGSSTRARRYIVSGSATLLRRKRG